MVYIDLKGCFSWDIFLYNILSDVNASAFNLYLYILVFFIFFPLLVAKLLFRLGYVLTYVCIKFIVTLNISLHFCSILTPLFPLSLKSFVFISYFSCHITILNWTIPSSVISGYLGGKCEFIWISKVYIPIPRYLKYYTLYYSLRCFLRTLW